MSIEEAAVNRSGAPAPSNLASLMGSLVSCDSGEQKAQSDHRRWKFWWKFPLVLAAVERYDGTLNYGPLFVQAITDMPDIPGDSGSQLPYQEFFPNHLAPI